MSGGHLCEAEAPTETTVETRKFAGRLSPYKNLQHSSRQNLPKRRALDFYVNKLYDTVWQLKPLYIMIHNQCDNAVKALRILYVVTIKIRI